MKELSEQLSDLSDRVKKTEDVVAAARQKNRANLEHQRDRLKTSIAERNAGIEEHLAEAKGQAEYAVVDAALARADADELALAG